MYTQFAMLQIPSATKLQEGRIMEAKNTKNWWYYSNKYLIHIFFILLLHDVIFHISIDELLNHLFKNICSNFWIFLELYKLHSKSLHVHAYIYRVTVHFGSNYKCIFISLPFVMPTVYESALALTERQCQL